MLSMFNGLWRACFARWPGVFLIILGCFGGAFFEVFESYDIKNFEMDYRRYLCEKSATPEVKRTYEIVKQVEEKFDGSDLFRRNGSYNRSEEDQALAEKRKYSLLSEGVAKGFIKKSDLDAWVEGQLNLDINTVFDFGGLQSSGLNTLFGRNFGDVIPRICAQFGGKYPAGIASISELNFDIGEARITSKKVQASVDALVDNSVVVEVRGADKNIWRYYFNLGGDRGNEKEDFILYAVGVVIDNSGMSREDIAIRSIAIDRALSKKYVRKSSVEEVRVTQSAGEVVNRVVYKMDNYVPNRKALLYSTDKTEEAFVIIDGLAAGNIERALGRAEFMEDVRRAK
jgi:hypothetical protein